MSELSILELETEHAELLPERETLFRIINIGNHVNVHQIALAVAAYGRNNTAVAVNVAIIGSGAAGGGS
jgi:hypothetical protein